MVAAGLIIAISGFTPPPWPAILIGASAGAAALIPIVYSYIIWRDDRSP